MLIQLVLDAVGLDLLDTGVAVGGVGLEPHLPGVQGDHGEPHALDHHGAQRHALLFTGGQQLIQLPLGRSGIVLLRHSQQLVGGFPLGGEDDDHIVARLVGVGDDSGHVADTIDVGDGRAAKFLYDQCHMRCNPPKYLQRAFGVYAPLQFMSEPGDCLNPAPDTAPSHPAPSAGL